MCVIDFLLHVCDWFSSCVWCLLQSDGSSHTGSSSGDQSDDSSSSDSSSSDSSDEDFEKQLRKMKVGLSLTPSHAGVTSPLPPTLILTRLP